MCTAIFLVLSILLCSFYNYFVHLYYYIRLTINVYIVVAKLTVLIYKHFKTKITRSIGGRHYGKLMYGKSSRSFMSFKTATVAWGTGAYIVKLMSAFGGGGFRFRFCYFELNVVCYNRFMIFYLYSFKASDQITYISEQLYIIILFLDQCSVEYITYNTWS